MLMQIMIIKKAIFENYAPFIKCMSKIYNTQIDNAKDINIVMAMYNLIADIVIIIQKHLEACGNTAKTYQLQIIMARLLNLMGLMLLIHLNLKAKTTGQTGANGTKEVEIMVPLNYLSNFWRTLENAFI